MTEAGNEHKKIVFGEFRLESDSRTLWRNGEELHLPKRPFDILKFLIENRERVVSRDELLDKFWDGHDVYDDALRKTVGTIRHALGDTKKPPRFIETRYGSGFRFIGDLSELPVVTGGLSSANSIEISKPRYILLTILSVCAVVLILFSFLSFRSNPENVSAKNETLAEKRSIAVLPLKNLTGDGGNDFLSDGITESIITELSRLSELKIISRSSTFALKDKEIKPTEIAEKLKVDSFLEGSLQKKGDALSVNVRLINAKNGRILWTSQNFERPVGSAFELQDIISCNVANELGAELCGLIAQNPRRYTKNADAYQNYLQGRFHWNERTGEGIKRSIEFYEKAIKADANFAPAYAGLSESYVQGMWHVPFASNEVLPKAKAAALKAVELDGTLSEAQTALGSVLQLEWNFAESRRALHRAVELNPRNARAFHVQAFALHLVGRNDEAVQSIERAFELDPMNLVVNTDRAQLLYFAGRSKEAFAQWQKTIELDPNFKLAHEHLAIAYQFSGNEKAAIEENVKLMQFNGQSLEKINAYRQTAEKFGLKEIYRKDLKDLLEKEKRGEKISNINAALLNAWLGETDEAFKYLEKCFLERDAALLLLPSPMFSALHSDARYADLLRRINLSED